MPDIAGVIQHVGLNMIDKTRATTRADADGNVWSVQPDGTLQKRPKGTQDAYETGVLDGQLWTVNSVPPDPQPGVSYMRTFVLANVSGL